MTRAAALACLLSLAPFAAHAAPPKPSPSHARASAGWPGKAWTTAKAYTYAWHPSAPPRESLRIFEPPRGLHSEVRNEAALTNEQAAQAVALVRVTEGEMEVSKCPFPRHGVVFYDADGRAVGSVSVCFECGDILVWPSAGKPSRRKAGRDGVYREAFMTRYDEVMTTWRAFFSALPDMPPDWNASKPPAKTVTP